MRIYLALDSVIAWSFVEITFLSVEISNRYPFAVAVRDESLRNVMWGLKQIRIRLTEPQCPRTL